MSVLPLEIINRGSKELKGFYICLFILAYALGRTFPSFSYSYVIFGLVAIYIIYESYNYTIDGENEMYIKIEDRIKYLDLVISESTKVQKTLLGLRINTYIPGFESSVQTDSYLYLDPNMVNLLYSVRDYEQYSPQCYQKILRLVNYTMKLLYDMQRVDPNGDIALKNCAVNFEVAQYFVKLSNNYFHSFIYALPVEKNYSNKFKRSMNRFRLLNKRNLDSMKYICDLQRKKSRVSISTKYIGPEYNGAKPYEDGDKYLFFT